MIHKASPALAAWKEATCGAELFTLHHGALVPDLGKGNQSFLANQQILQNSV